MTNSLQRLTDLINFLKLHEVVPQSNKKLSLETFNELTNELKTQRCSFLNENIEELKRKIRENYKKLRISALSLMEYDWNENSHSNILAYLIDYNSFDEGHKILSQMVEDVSPQNNKDLCKKILKGTYTVDREHHIPSGRIDLFILDESEKFVIIIENKIFAEISKTIGEDENSMEVTQLERYEKWCDDNYTDFTRLYILLNYSTSDENTFSFEKISYRQLYNTLKIIESGDNIFNEYLLLLETILNSVAQDLFEIKKLAKKIIDNEEPKISLTDYYILKTIFYAK